MFCVDEIDISRCVTTVVELRICFFMLLYVMVLFFNSPFLNVPQKIALIVKENLTTV